MNGIFVCVLVVFSVVLVNCKEIVKGQADAKCNQPLGHYKELNCKPIYSKTNTECIERYDCPFVKNSLENDKCYYKGKSYEIKEQLENNVNAHKCSVDCSCSKQYDGSAEFSCAQVECPENFEPPSPDNKCVRQYKHHQCCSDKEICDENEIKKLAKCTWESKIYREGEKFYPEDSCKECICSADYDGTLEGSWCRDVNCAVELYHGAEVRKMCAPIYLQNRNCCPIEWRCANEEHTIEAVAAVKSTDPDMKCHFGDKTLDIGDKVMGSDECVTCTCSVPPLVSCTRMRDCPN